MPRNDPVCVRPSELVRFARPKSQRYAWSPGSATRMFAGLTSRCTRPAACAASSAPPICCAIRERLRRASSAPRVLSSACRLGPLDVAHREEEDAVDLVGVVDRDHVRVVERRGELRLAEEARAELLVVRELRRRSPSAPPCARGARASRGRRCPCRRGRAATRSCSRRTPRRRRVRAVSHRTSAFDSRAGARSRSGARRRTARASCAAPRRASRARLARVHRLVGPDRVHQLVVRAERRRAAAAAFRSTM